MTVPGPSTDSCRLCAAGPGGGFEIAAALPAEVAALLGLCLPGWRCEADAAASGRETLSVVGQGEGYAVRHDLLENGCFEAGTAIEAANAVAGAATGAWVRSRPDWVQLHAAAVELDGGPDRTGGLTLLLGASGAGKSTLALECAAAGHRLFGDDRIAVRLDDCASGAGAVGTALGVGAKLRLPLPAHSSAPLRRLAASSTGFDGGSVAFLELPPALLAQPGCSAPLRRLLLVERSGDIDGAVAGLGGEARLEPVEAPAVLRALLPNALAPGLAPGGLLDWCRRLAGRLPCRRLRYREAAAARRLIEAG